MLFFLLIISISASFAQVKVIKGNVTSKEGSPIPGVNILQKGSLNGKSYFQFFSLAS